MLLGAAALGSPVADRILATLERKVPSAGSNN
jgi:hypothetical protein